MIVKGNGCVQSRILEEAVRSCFILRALPTCLKPGGNDLAVSEITSPTNLDEIIEVMKNKGEKALKTKKNS